MGNVEARQSVMAAFCVDDVELIRFHKIRHPLTSWITINCRKNLLNPFLLYLTVSKLFFFIILQMVGFLGRVISSSQGLYLIKGQHRHRINTYTYQRSMPCVGFEHTIPACERAKTVHALDRAATVTGRTKENVVKYVR
jgi:hypothetical protein